MKNNQKFDICFYFILMVFVCSIPIMLYFDSQNLTYVEGVITDKKIEYQIDYNVYEVYYLQLNYTDNWFKVSVNIYNHYNISDYIYLSDLYYLN